MVRDFCGHGLGRIFHALPNIVHYGKPGHGMALKPGMFFTIEPMINLGGYGVKVLNDGWTAVTRDRSLSAQFEHSVGVTENGVEIFTLSPKGWTSRLTSEISETRGSSSQMRHDPQCRSSRAAARPLPERRRRRDAGL